MLPVLAYPVREGRLAHQGVGDAGEKLVVGQVEGRGVEAMDFPLGGRRENGEELRRLVPEQREQGHADQMRLRTDSCHAVRSFVARMSFDASKRKRERS